MRVHPPKSRTLAGVWAALVLFAFAATGTLADEPKRPATRNPVLSLDEKYEKLKGGIFKTKEAEVVDLLGPALTTTRPGKQDKSDIELRWQFDTRIFVTYKSGKVSELWGEFSEHLPVEKITGANLRRVKLGMTEKDVIDILGDRYASVSIDGVEMGQWGASAQFKVAFNKDGRMIHHERSGHSYGPR